MSQQGRVPRKPLPPQKPYVPEYVRWNKQPILMDRSGRVLEPQSVEQQRAVHLSPERANPQEHARVGATDRIRQRQGFMDQAQGGPQWPNNLPLPNDIPRQGPVPYSTGGQEQLWTMNGESIPEDDEVLIDADQYNVPYQGFRPPGNTEDQNQTDDLTDQAVDSGPAADTSDFVSPGGYLLLIKGKIIARGNLELMNRVVSDIIYDRDPDYKGMAIDPDDFIVLKRMKLRVGVSIE